MKILIFYATYGGGHLSTAKSMEEAINKFYPNYEVEMCDCMKYLSKTVNYMTVKSYEGMAKKTPRLWGRIYKASRKGLVAEISSSVNRLYARKLGRLINRINPDIIISTHPFSTQMCGILKKHKKINIPIATIMTDFKYHEQWLVKNKYIDKFFVSNEKMKLDLIKKGIEEEKIYNTGIPVSQKFYINHNKKEILKEFGLKENLKTILFFAGGKMGLARKNIFSYMEVISNNFKDIQVVAISGKNEKIYKEFMKIASDNDNIKVIEFSDKIPELMSIADFIITKPGGITISEAMASNVPLLIINPIPGQEEENAEYLETMGLAHWIKNDSDIENEIREMIKDDNLKLIKEKMKKYYKINVAENICKNILDKSHN